MLRLDCSLARLREAEAWHAARPCIYGTSDCYLLPIDCAVAITGHDPWPEDRGRYSTRNGAIRLLLARGYRSVADAFAAFYDEIPVTAAEDGDIGAIADPPGIGGYVGGVFMGGVFIGKSERGNCRVPRLVVAKAFRVGRVHL